MGISLERSTSLSWRLLGWVNNAVITLLSLDCVAVVAFFSSWRMTLSIAILKSVGDLIPLYCSKFMLPALFAVSTSSFSLTLIGEITTSATLVSLFFSRGTELGA